MASVDSHRDDPRAERPRAAGADVRVGSLEDPIAVRDAMRDVQRAYFCPPLEPGALRRAAIFAEVGDNTLWRRRAFGFWLVPSQIEATNLQQWGYANSTTHSDTRRDFPVLRE